MAANWSSRRHGAPQWDFKRSAPYQTELSTKKLILHIINQF